jgi:hypothetical protein
MLLLSTIHAEEDGIDEASKVNIETSIELFNECNNSSNCNMPTFSFSIENKSKHTFTLYPFYSSSYILITPSGKSFENIFKASRFFKNKSKLIFKPNDKREYVRSFSFIFTRLLEHNLNIIEGDYTILWRGYVRDGKHDTKYENKILFRVTKNLKICKYCISKHNDVDLLTLYELSLSQTNIWHVLETNKIDKELMSRKNKVLPRELFRKFNYYQKIEGNKGLFNVASLDMNSSKLLMSYKRLGIYTSQNMFFEIYNCTGSKYPALRAKVVELLEPYKIVATNRRFKMISRLLTDKNSKVTYANLASLQKQIEEAEKISDTAVIYLIDARNKTKSDVVVNKINLLSEFDKTIDLCHKKLKNMKKSSVEEQESVIKSLKLIDEFLKNQKKASDE